MRSITFAHTAALACALLAANVTCAQDRYDDRDVPPAVAQKQHQEIKHGDPARWYKPQPRLQNLHKEIAAAYDEAKRACTLESKSERSSCMADARNTYQSDMANARNLAKAPPPQLGSSSSSETRSGQ